MSVLICIGLIRIGDADAVVVLVFDGISISITNTAALGDIWLEGAGVTSITQIISITVRLTTFIQGTDRVKERGAVIVGIGDSVAILVAFGDSPSVGIGVTVTVFFSSQRFTGGFIPGHPAMNNAVVKTGCQFVEAPVGLLPCADSVCFFPQTWTGSQLSVVALILPALPDSR